MGQIQNMTRTVIKEISAAKRTSEVDVFSTLIEKRQIFFGLEFDEFLCNTVMAQLLYLDSKPDDDGNLHSPITIYINSPGGYCYDGLGVIDMLNHIKSPVKTIVIGKAMSMGAILLCSGSKRAAMPNARIMIHQPSGGVSGQSTDIQITAKEIQYLRDTLTQMLVDNSKGKLSLEKANELMERDTYLSPQEAMDLGIIDTIIK